MTDPLAAPLCPYPLRPGCGGRLVWITGYPGTGKSTAAQMMARNHGQHAVHYSHYIFHIMIAGYVFFEGDCFGRLLNPYIPVMAENASLAQVGLIALMCLPSVLQIFIYPTFSRIFLQLVQRRLEGEGAEYRRELYRQVEGQYDPEKVREFSGLLCDELKRERLRIGGDWAVASAWLNNRGVRDAVRWVGVELPMNLREVSQCLRPLY